MVDSDGREMVDKSTTCEKCKEKLIFLGKYPTCKCTNTFDKKSTRSPIKKDENRKGKGEKT
jgi:hypothetical protein